MTMAQLTWMNRKGAGCMRAGTVTELGKRMETLRCEAKLRLLDGTVIGEVTRHPENPKRWLWWYEKDAN
jgi:hypothetical protein